MNIIRHLFASKENSDKDYAFFKGGAFTYKQIYSGILKICTLLKGTKQKRFLVLAENSPFFISSYFGIIASGNIAVPLNIRGGEAELKEIISRVRPEAVFTDNDLIDNLGELGINKVYNPTCISDPIEGEVTDEIDEKKDAAVIMFTSGSSGKPKGVVISHKNIMANTDSIVSYLELNDKDRVEVVLPFHYCYGLSLLHTHTKAGGSIVLNNSFINPSTVIRDIKKYSCTGFAGVPSHFEILIKTTRFLEEDFPSLRYITQAGGKMRDETISLIYNSLKNTSLFIMYGQTEATARLSYLPPEYLPAKIGSIGMGIPNVELKIVDSRGEEVSSGEVGELVAKGDNIMLGYFDEEKSTWDKIKEGYLYTGDFAKRDNDGFIYLVGRRDDLIKTGGHRVSLLEINEELRKISGIVDCYTINKESKLFGNDLITLLVLEKNLKKEDVISEIRKKIVSYKIPSDFIVVNKIPLTPAGKIAKEEIERIIKDDR